MDGIYLDLNDITEKEIDVLKGEFDEIVKTRLNEIKYENTKASLICIIRGTMDYFGELNTKFLGQDNDRCLPSKEADSFANNFYRLNNALEYICKLEGLSLETTENWNLLKDIRTLIVHSGQQLDNFPSIKLGGYKDAQLGDIIARGEEKLNIEFPGPYDYKITIWIDKHDKSKRQENVVDYDYQKENFSDVNIYLNSADVKKVIFSQFDSFIKQMNHKNIKQKKRPTLPETVRQMVTENGDFDKLEALIKNRKRGYYYCESGEAYWPGFGLKRLWNYVEVTDEVKSKIRNIITDRLKIFCKKFNDESIEDFELPSLDVRDVFSEYTPDYDGKCYLEGEKLFENIAPNFNKKDGSVHTDVDYLIKFILAAEEALGDDYHLKLENDVDGLVCDYFVQSVAWKLHLNKR